MHKHKENCESRWGEMAHTESMRSCRAVQFHNQCVHTCAMYADDGSEVCARVWFLQRKTLCHYTILPETGNLYTTLLTQSTFTLLFLKLAVLFHTLLNFPKNIISLVTYQFCLLLMVISLQLPSSRRVTLRASLSSKQYVSIIFGASPRGHQVNRNQVGIFHFPLATEL